MLQTLKSFLIIILVFTGGASIAQGTISKWNNYKGENISVYTNKPYYLSGEIIWFKLYVTKPGDNRPTDLSNAVYAELLDSTGVVFHSKIALKNGNGNGSFSLPDNILSGVYTLKAYTTGMKNVSADFYFQNKITIINYLQWARDPSVISLKNEEEASSNSKAISVNIHPDKSSYSSREKISVDVFLDKINKPEYAHLTLSVYKLNAGLDEDQNISAQVQNAYAPAIVQYSLASPFYGVAEEHYRMDDYTRFNSMEEVFREYVTGVGVGVSNKKFRLFIYDDITRKPFDRNPFIMIDGAPITDIQKVMALDPLKIKTVDVVTRKYYLGSDTFYGVIDLQSYNGDMAGYEPDDSSHVYAYQRIPPQLVFESPIYVTPAQKSSRHPDFRSCLYWEPNFETDDSGNRHIEFYSSDNKGQFIIKVTGITADGRPCDGSALISVE